MSDSSELPENPATSGTSPEDAFRNAAAAELPPVEPPSAGFIIQLFVVPALIVALIVGVWAMFGKLAAGKQDWQKLVQELAHPNPNRHQRAAVGLGQMLRADLELGDEGEQLSSNPEIASALSDLLAGQLKTPTQDEERLQQQAFLARTLGLLDVTDVVLPVLCEATQASQDVDIRKDAIAAIAMIAGRGLERETPVESAATLDALIEATRDDDVAVRQVATFALGLFPQEVAQLRLEVLLDNVDINTQVNAAIGLARNGSLAGLPLFKEYLREAAEPFDPADLDALDAERKAELTEAKLRQEPLILKNAFKAMTDLREQFEPQERQELIGLLEPLTRVHGNEVVRMESRKLILALGGE